MIQVLAVLRCACMVHLQAQINAPRVWCGMVAPAAAAALTALPTSVGAGWLAATLSCVWLLAQVVAAQVVVAQIVVAYVAVAQVVCSVFHCRANGRVERLVDETGQPMGPHRVWLQYAWIPGLAMSRALGDVLAHQVSAGAGWAGLRAGRQRACRCLLARLLHWPGACTMQLAWHMCPQ
jgi:hypothetical protein